MVTAGSNSRAFSSRGWSPITGTRRFQRPRLPAGHVEVDDIDETFARLRERGAELVSNEVVQYENSYRLYYIRGPEGVLIGLAEELR